MKSLHNKNYTFQENFQETFKRDVKWGFFHSEKSRIKTFSFENPDHENEVFELLRNYRFMIDQIECLLNIPDEKKVKKT